MLADALVTELGMHAQQIEGGEQAPSKVGIGGDNTGWDAVAFADDDAVGELVAVIDGPPASRSTYQCYSSLYAHFAYYFSFDTLKTTQRD